MVSGRLSAALRPAGLNAAMALAACVLLAEAIAALPLKEPVSNPAGTNEIQASFHLVEEAITMAPGDAYGALAAQGQARGCCYARARACVHTREHSCGQFSGAPTSQRQMDGRLLRVWPCLAQPVRGGDATEAVRLGAAQGVASWGGRRSEAASGARQQTCNDGRMRATCSGCGARGRWRGVARFC